MTEVYTNSYAPPPWLNEEFVQSALRQGLRRESLNVSSCKFRPATNVGDNYLSQMFRCSAKLESRRKGREEMCVLVKSMPKGELVEAFVNESAFFTRETQMMSETLPEFNRILEGIGRKVLCAQLYYKQAQPDQMLLIEDLCQVGFKSANRFEGLDLPHTFLTVQSLADFHSASLIEIEQKPSMKTEYFSSYWSKLFEDRVRKFTLDGIKTLEHCCEVWGTLPKDLPEKLEKLKTTGLEKLFESTDRLESDLNVLNHGDPWTSNLLFKYEDGQPKEIKLVDFQLSCYNSPVYDLQYFIYTSVKNEYKVAKLDEILMCYHERLTENCKRLKYPLNFTFDDLKKTYLRRIFFGFFMTSCLLPFMIVPSKDVQDLNEMLDETKETVHVVHSIQNFKEAAETVIPFFAENGVFD